MDDYDRPAVPAPSFVPTRLSFSAKYFHSANFWYRYNRSYLRPERSEEILGDRQYWQLGFENVFVPEYHGSKAILGQY